MTTTYYTHQPLRALWSFGMVMQQQLAMPMEVDCLYLALSAGAAAAAGWMNG